MKFPETFPEVCLAFPKFHNAKIIDFRAVSLCLQGKTS